VGRAHGCTHGIRNSGTCASIREGQEMSGRTCDVNKCATIRWVTQEPRFVILTFNFFSVLDGAQVSGTE
jgi:hypothetical protein